MIERGEGGQAIVQRVPDRKQRTLFKLIKRWVRPNTTIISDEWPAYRQLERHMPQYRCRKMLIILNLKNYLFCWTIKNYLLRIISQTILNIYFQFKLLQEKA